MGDLGMLKMNMKEIKEFLNEIELINTQFKSYILESESKIIEKINHLEKLENKINSKKDI